MGIKRGPLSAWPSWHQRLCEVGKVWECLKLLRRQATSKLEWDAITFNAAISACEKAGQWEKALQLFGAMAKSNVELDTITFDAAICACETGERKHALQLFGLIAALLMMFELHCCKQRCEGLEEFKGCQKM